MRIRKERENIQKSDTGNNARGRMRDAISLPEACNRAECPNNPGSRAGTHAMIRNQATGAGRNTPVSAKTRVFASISCKSGANNASTFRRGTKRIYGIACLVLALCLLTGAAGASINVWRVIVNPDGELVRDQTPVNATVLMDITSEGDFTFSDDNRVEMWTDLEDPVWTPVLSMEGVIIPLGVRTTRHIEFTPWELSYPSGTGLSMKVDLKGYAPNVTSTQEKTIVRVAEFTPNAIVNGTEVVKKRTVTYVEHPQRPVPDPTPSPDRALVSLSSTPPGAEVWEESVLKGTSPLDLPDVPAGTHTYRFSLPGYNDASLTVTVVSGQKLSLATGLSPASSPEVTIPGNLPPADTLSGDPSPGSLRITSEPAGALVYLDGELAGSTPFTPDELSPGVHSIKAVLPGFEDYSGTVEVVQGRDQTMVLNFGRSSQDSNGAGGVLFTSSPPGADVTIDGTLRGITPISLTDLTRGSHSVRMSLPFFEDYTSTFRYTGEPVEISGSFSLGRLKFPGFGFITGLFSGIALPGSGAGKETGSASASDKQKAYDELVSQMDSGD